MDQKMKQLLEYLGALLGVFLLVYLGFLIKTQYASPVDLSKIRTVTMTAEGKVSAKPDTATINFSVVTTGKQAADVQKENDGKMAKVIEFLKGKGVAADDIQTANYNLYPQYDYNTLQQPAPITGYTLNQQVTAKVRDLESVKVITGGLTGQGVNQIENIGYSIDDPDALKAQARQQAVNKAKDKAKELAANLGVRLGKVVNFSEGSSGGIIPIYDSYGRGAGGGGASPLEPGTQDIQVEVTLTFELK